MCHVLDANLSDFYVLLLNILWSVFDAEKCVCVYQFNEYFSCVCFYDFILQWEEPYVSFLVGFIFVLRGVLAVAVLLNMLGFVEDGFTGRNFR